MHCTPVGHSKPTPQRHAPPPQLSARCGSHARHAAPAAPHCAVVVGETHVVPLQQPVLQEVESHTQVSATQRCPVPHAGLVPQRHSPLAQVLERVVLHVVHARPFEPH